MIYTVNRYLLYPRVWSSIWECKFVDIVLFYDNQKWISLQRCHQSFFYFRWQISVVARRFPPLSLLVIPTHFYSICVYRMVLLIWVSFFRRKKKCPSKDESWISGYLFREVQLRKLCFDKSTVDISTNRMKRAVSLIFV